MISTIAILIFKKKKKKNIQNKLKPNNIQYNTIQGYTIKENCT